MLNRLATAVGLLVLCAITIVHVERPDAPVPATAPDTEFSAERAMRHVAQIAQRPHPLGGADHDRVRDYIVAQITALGLQPQVQRTTAVGTRYQEAGRVENVLAWIPGSEANGKALLLMVHYDGVGAGPAASDDGAGVAALLETLRALRARKTPLAHDVMALFTDGEESGLLGAAAFVREHKWARDVAMVINFEARGTTGRSFMFETGPGNLDAARLLRHTGHTSAGSVYTTIYRTLPNDTDLSELSVLGQPALNFAFTGGVERYHTSKDDSAHLNPGSLQEHGRHMLALTTLVANQALPRPVTGDAVFFDLPVMGLVVYSVVLAIPLALIALALVTAAFVRGRRTLIEGAGRPMPAVGSVGVAFGVGLTIVAVGLAGVAGWVIGRILSGPAVWSATYAFGVALVALAVAAACYTVARRWATARSLHMGVLWVWLVIALYVSVASPGVSYLFVWPLLFAAGAALMPRGVGRTVIEWTAVALALFTLGGVAYGASVIMLGLAGAGAIVLAVALALIALLLVPTLDPLVHGVRWSGAHMAGVAALVVLAFGALTVHTNADHPQRSALVYAQNADSTDAWLLSPSGLTNDWTRVVLGTTQPVPAWTRRLSVRAGRFAGRAVPRVPLAAPNAEFVREIVINGARRLVFRITAPPGATSLSMRARGAPVLTSSIDGRIVDTTRYRTRFPDWVMQYGAVPDSGAVIALSIPLGTHIDLDLASSTPGLPALPGVVVPPRPANVVPSQDGDVSVVYRVFRF